MISIGNIFKTNPAEFDEVWVICFAVDELRSLFEDFDNVFHVPELAPKESLFKEYPIYLKGQRLSLWTGMRIMYLRLY